MSECVLVTGASGLVGGDVLRLLRAHGSPEDSLVVLGHRRRAPLALPCGSPEADGMAGPTVEILQGDITREDLGLARRERSALQERLTAVLHCAATTRFSVTKEEAERTNMDGTRHLLAFASQARRLQRFGHVSTAFVAGRRTGTILESDLEHYAGFVNAYEWSKYEAERLVRGSGLPWAVYRLSALVGNAESGRIRAYSGVHWTVSALHDGVAPALPGLPSSPVDFIPDEFAAAGIHHLFTHFAAEQTYHLCAGAGKTLALDAVIAAIAHAAQRCPSCGGSDPVRPAIVDGETFDRLARSARAAGEARVARVLEGMAHFTPQMLYPKQFDCCQAERALAGSGISAPALGSYWPRIVMHCVHRPGTASASRPQRWAA